MSLKPTRIDADVMSAALDRIRRIYDLHDRVVVSFSGGKVNRAGMPTQVRRVAPALNKAWVPGKG